MYERCVLKHTKGNSPVSLWSILFSACCRGAFLQILWGQKLHFSFFLPSPRGSAPLCRACPVQSLQSHLLCSGSSIVLIRDDQDEGGGGGKHKLGDSNLREEKEGPNLGKASHTAHDPVSTPLLLLTDLTAPHTTAVHALHAAAVHTGLATLGTSEAQSSGRTGGGSTGESGVAGVD